MPFTPTAPVTEPEESAENTRSLADLFKLLALLLIILNTFVIGASLVIYSQRMPSHKNQVTIVNPTSSYPSSFENEILEAPPKTELPSSSEDTTSGERILSNVRQDVESEQRAVQEQQFAAVQSSGILSLGNKKVNLSQASATFSNQQIVLLLKMSDRAQTATCASLQLKFDPFRRSCDPLSVRKVSFTLFPSCLGLEKPLAIERDNVREETGLTQMRCERKAGGQLDYAIETNLPNGTQVIKLSASGHLIMD